MKFQHPSSNQQFRKSAEEFMNNPGLNMQREITKSLAFLLLFCCAAAPRAEMPDSVIFPGSFIKQDTLNARISSLMRIGNVHLEQEDTELARGTFEKALKLDSTDPRIYIGIGRCYLERKDRRIKIFQIIERFFDKDFISKAIKYFNKALELNPDSWEAHYWLANAFIKRFGSNDLKLALEHMTKARELGGGHKDILFRSAVLHKALGDLRNAEQILSQLGSENEEKADPLANLELVKISIHRGKYNEALRYYWAGVKAISTEEELKAYFDEAVVLVNAQEHQQFAETSPEEAEQFFRTFWLKRDHELGLFPGMRLVQHYYRINVADSLYRVPFPSRSPAIMPVVEYFPEESVPYDDRGVIYLRHGQPDRSVSHVGEGLYPNITWIYHRNGKDLILNFVALRGVHEYQLVSSLDAAVMNFRGVFASDADGNFPTNAAESFRLQAMKEIYSSRLEIARGIYFRLLNNPYDPFAHLEEYEKNIVSLKTALATESVTSPYRRQLNSYYDLVEFRGKSDGKSRLEFFSGIPGGDISYSTGEDGYHYDIAYQLGIYDQQWRQVERFEEVEQHQSSINPKDLMDRLVVGLGKIDLIPGDYYYFVRIQNGSAVGNFNGKIHVDSFASDSLQASQILTAQDIFSSPANSSKFKRFNLEVYPHPSRIFRPSEKMYAYQEIYNLIPDEEGNYNYRLIYTITLVKRDRNMFGKIYDSFKSMIGAGSGREQVVLAVEKKKAPVDHKMVHEEVAIDISDNPDGLYELSIRVEDLNNSGSTFQRNTRFFVHQ
jgi:tetratricopeptide (TPR) repeat protein